MTDQAPSTLNITPSPRILEMIAEVDLQLHQCLGELIDNSLDELVEAVDEDPTIEPRIDISLPKSSQASKNAQVVVGENGRGMTAEQLQDALSAGTSGKQRFGSLGLFGMGFNIATARLGTVTEVRTGCKCDDEWVIATIDLTVMQRERTYEIPLRYEPKSADEHGTTITVTNLREDMVHRLKSTRAIKEAKAHLGRMYTYMLRDPNNGHSGASLIGGAKQRIYLNGTAVRPHLPCIWDPEHSVTYKGSDVSAAKAIDIPLTKAYACMNCGRWYPSEREQCVECESTDLAERERRIWGWIGIQRYFDKSDFGLTFVRHGRAITYQDKSLFNWETPDGDIDLEYPIELGMGRIVGEIHLDHAPVNIRKNSFDTASAEWRFMVEKVRGEEPLRPQYAKRLMGRENTSPLSAFFNAYRDVKPGVGNLIPGNGSQGIHDAAKKWAAKFREGDPDYLTDDKWYEAAEAHDRIKDGPASEPTPDPDAEDDWFKREGLGHLAGDDDDVTDESEGHSPEPVKQETEEERFSRYQDHAVLLPDTGKKVQLGTTDAVLRIYLADGVDLARPGEPEKPSIAIRVVAGEIEIFVDGSTALIADFGWSPLSVALLCAAPTLVSIYKLDGQAADIVVDLMQQFPDRKVDLSAVRSRGDALLEAMRERLAELAPKEPEAFWEALSPQARQEAETNAIAIASDVDWGGAVESGESARYIGVNGVTDLVSNGPELVLDGALFKATYDKLGEDSKADQVARIEALLADLRRMVVGPQSQNTRELSRSLLTADLLDAEIIAR